MFRWAAGSNVGWGAGVQRRRGELVDSEDSIAAEKQ
jgi:hypothetical protein